MARIKWPLVRTPFFIRSGCTNGGSVCRAFKGNFSTTLSPRSAQPSVTSLQYVNSPVEDPNMHLIYWRTAEIDPVEEGGTGPRLPRSVQAVYLRPLRREAKYGLPTCDLQLRSYSVRNLEFFADFALRAAYYLHLPAFGPIPLPRITERWTVPKANFIFKKSQENFERITLRRLIQIKDGHPESVQLWLAFLRKHAYYGIGMKANVWEFNELGVGKSMDVGLEDLKKVMDPEWGHFGRKKSQETSQKVVEWMNNENFKRAATGIGPLKYPKP